MPGRERCTDGLEITLRGIPLHRGPGRCAIVEEALRGGDTAQPRSPTQESRVSPGGPLIELWDEECVKITARCRQGSQRPLGKLICNKLDDGLEDLQWEAAERGHGGQRSEISPTR